MKTDQYHHLIAKSEGRTVLIAFTAAWSGAAQLLVNMLEMSRKDLGNVTIGEIDVDANEDLISNLGISKVPTTLIVQDRVVVDLFTGTISRRELINRVHAVAV